MDDHPVRNQHEPSYFRRRGDPREAQEICGGRVVPWQWVQNLDFSSWDEEARRAVIEEILNRNVRGMSSLDEEEYLERIRNGRVYFNAENFGGGRSLVDERDPSCLVQELRSYTSYGLQSSTLNDCSDEREREILSMTGGMKVLLGEVLENLQDAEKHSFRCRAGCFGQMPAQCVEIKNNACATRGSSETSGKENSRGTTGTQDQPTTSCVESRSNRKSVETSGADFKSGGAVISGVEHTALNLWRREVTSDKETIGMDLRLENERECDAGKVWGYGFSKPSADELSNMAEIAAYDQATPPKLLKASSPEIRPPKERLGDGNNNELEELKAASAVGTNQSVGKEAENPKHESQDCEVNPYNPFETEEDCNPRSESCKGADLIDILFRTSEDDNSRKRILPLQVVLNADSHNSESPYSGSRDEGVSSEGKDISPQKNTVILRRLASNLKETTKYAKSLIEKRTDACKKNLKPGPRTLMRNASLESDLFRPLKNPTAKRSLLLGSINSSPKSAPAMLSLPPAMKFEEFQTNTEINKTLCDFASSQRERAPNNRTLSKQSSSAAISGNHKRNLYPKAFALEMLMPQNQASVKLDERELAYQKAVQIPVNNFSFDDERNSFVTAKKCTDLLKTLDVPSSRRSTGDSISSPRYSLETDDSNKSYEDFTNTLGTKTTRSSRSRCGKLAKRPANFNVGIRKYYYTFSPSSASIVRHRRSLTAVISPPKKRSGSLTYLSKLRKTAKRSSYESSDSKLHSRDKETLGNLPVLSKLNLSPEKRIGNALFKCCPSGSEFSKHPPKFQAESKEHNHLVRDKEQRTAKCLVQNSNKQGTSNYIHLHHLNKSCLHGGSSNIPLANGSQEKLVSPSKRKKQSPSAVEGLEMSTKTPSKKARKMLLAVAKSRSKTHKTHTGLGSLPKDTRSPNKKEKFTWHRFMFKSCNPAQMTEMKNTQTNAC